MSRGAIVAAVAAAAGVAGEVVGASPAGALDGEPLLIGTANSNTTNTTQLSGSTTTASTAMFGVQQSASVGDAIGIKAHITGSSIQATAVYGLQQAAGVGGIDVLGEAVTAGTPGIAAGTGVVASSQTGASLRLINNSPPAMPPVAGEWNAGSFLVDAAKQLWYCTVSGEGSASQWLRLSSPLVPLESPVRIYYSLTAGDPPLGNGEERPVTVTNGTTIPHTASAVLTNLAVTPAGSDGFLAMFKNGTAWPGTSNLNFTAGQFASNNATSAVESGGVGKVRIRCGGASVHFVIDVFGYYP